jgi:hypothetical protein
LIQRQLTLGISIVAIQAADPVCLTHHFYSESSESGCRRTVLELIGAHHNSTWSSAFCQILGRSSQPDAKQS